MLICLILLASRDVIKDTESKAAKFMNILMNWNLNIVT